MSSTKLVNVSCTIWKTLAFKEKVIAMLEGVSMVFDLSYSSYFVPFIKTYKRKNKRNKRHFERLANELEFASHVVDKGSIY